MKDYLSRLGFMMAIIMTLLLSSMGPALACGGHHQHKHVTVNAYFNDQTCIDGVYTAPTIEVPAYDGTTVVVTGTPAPGAVVDVKFSPDQGVVIDGQSDFMHTYPSSPTLASCTPTPVFKHGYVNVIHLPSCKRSERVVKVVDEHGVKLTITRHNKNRQNWHVRVVMRHGWKIRANLLTHRGPWVKTAHAIIHLRHVGRCGKPHPGSG